MGEAVLSLERVGDKKRMLWCMLRPKLSPTAPRSEGTEVVAALEDGVVSVATAAEVIKADELLPGY